MDNVSPAYYSPQSLRQHQLGIGFDDKFGWIQPSVTYLPGVGQERGTQLDFIQDVDAGIVFHLGSRTTLEPFYGLTKTPTYRRDSYNVVLTHRF